MDTTLWRQARLRAGEYGLDRTGVLGALLSAFTEGRLSIEAPPQGALGPTRNGVGRAGCRTGPLPDTVWERADVARRRAGVKSMPVLCELLLRGFVDGHVSVTLTVTGGVIPGTTGMRKGAVA